MSNEKQKTAFEWYLQECIILDMKRDNCHHTGFTYEDYCLAKIKLIERTKAKEKKQMRKIYNGILQNVGTSIKQSDLPTFEQYYNETYEQ
jgi:hypothetical protein